MSLGDSKNQVDLAFASSNLRGLAFENAFGGATSFLRRRYTKDLAGVDLAFTGVPFDLGVTNRPGARFGPRAVRIASSLLPFDPPYGWGYSPLESLNIIDYGDVAFDYAKPQDFPAALSAHIAGILAAGVGVISLGGDHFISLPILQAFAQKYGPISLVQFDAHSDTWPDDDLERLDHGTWTYKAVKAGLIDPKTSCLVGIRTHCEDYCGLKIIDAPSIHQRSIDQISQVIKSLVGDRPTYISFDIDALDPAYAPGTGTPVWGGLASWQVAALLRALAGINLVGGDVTEVAPPFDPTGITAIAGAHVATELLCLYGWAKRGG